MSTLQMEHVKSEQTALNHETGYDIHAITANQLRVNRLSLGCATLDAITGGGFPLFPITEFVGEAGVGKTQLLMTLALTALLPHEENGLDAGTLYISTEGRVPLPRMREFLEKNAELNARLPQNAMDRIFIEDSISDAEVLWMMIKEKLPPLLASGAVRLVVIDSIAALFRGEFMAGERAMHDRNDWFFGLASMMKRLSHEYDCYFLVSNQVSFDPRLNSLKPALGLAWSSCINQRISLEFTKSSDELESLGENQFHGIRIDISRRRRLSVVFSPSMPCGVICDSCFIGTDGMKAVVGVPSTTTIPQDAPDTLPISPESSSTVSVII